ncbi:putative COX11-cytochrome-c oxidase assembly protein [Testicularia cyperi]|uniref:Putative COX11-cytochrome-c oxidase assembly protein n=1 Tax=Testicularia cyperi TaxID=1882483 RepID=A0A317XG32_9BASI|nr:putative COX11-cytochrome-c oxidase assembly protein [Testicularia cyperi]
MLATSSSSFALARSCSRMAARTSEARFGHAQLRSPLARMAHSWAVESRTSPTTGLPATRNMSMKLGLVSRFSTSSLARASEAGSSSASSNTTASASSRAAAMNEEFRRRQQAAYKKRNQSLLMYSAATMFFFVGFTYAAVPLYRAFCSATGFSGTPITDPERFAPSRLIPAYLDPATNAPTKRIRVTFNADASDAIPWSFTPQQKEIYVLPGETALAFYTAKNKSDKDIIGIATYNVSPDRIAPYFAKVECFCFEEQKLLAGEEVDLPVFFFIDSDVLDDPTTKGVDDVVLSYTFFSARRNPKNGQLEPDTDLSKYTVGKDL